MFSVLFLKIALNLMFLQLPYGGQAVHRVPRKPGDALGDDEVDGAGKGIRHHFVKSVALLGIAAGDALVSFCQARTKNIL